MNITVMDESLCSTVLIMLGVQTDFEGPHALGQRAPLLHGSNNNYEVMADYTPLSGFTTPHPINFVNLSNPSHPTNISTHQVSMDSTSTPFLPYEEPMLKTVLHWCIPIICIFGVVGNIMNLIVLTLRVREGAEVMEKGVLYGLISLALSDLLFCVVTIPGSFIGNRGLAFLDRGLPFLYALASEAVQVIDNISNPYLSSHYISHIYQSISSLSIHGLSFHANPRYIILGHTILVHTIPGHTIPGHTILGHVMAYVVQLSTSH